MKTKKQFMNQILWGFIFALLLPMAKLYPITINSDYREYEDYLKKYVDSELQKYFGSTVKFSTFIRVVPAKGEQNINDKEREYDLGYLPQTLSKIDDTKKKEMEIEGVEARVFVYGDVANQISGEISDIVSNALSGLNPETKVKVVKELPKIIEEVSDKNSEKLLQDLKQDKNQEVKQEEKKIKLPEISLKDRILNQLGEILNILKTVIILVFVFGFFWHITKSIKSIIAAFERSIKGVIAEYFNKEKLSKNLEDDPNGLMNENGNKDDHFETKEGEIIKNDNSIFVKESVTVTKKIEELVTSFKDIITKSPEHLRRSINDSDLPGIHSILQYLSFSERDIISNSLSDNSRRALESMLTKGEIVTLRGIELVKWLMSFNDKMLISSINNKNSFVDLISEEDFSQLKMVDAETLMDIGKRMSSPVAWHVIVEFIPKHYLNNLVNYFTPREWEIFLGNKQMKYSEQELVATVKNILILAKSKERRITNIVSASQEYIVGSVVGIIRKKAVGEDFQFAEKIKSVAPGLYDKLNEFVWMVTDLDMVPESYMEKYLRAIDINDKIKLFFGVSEHIHIYNYLYDLIPDGKAKIIINDGVNAMKNRKNQEEDGIAYLFTRNILNALFDDWKSGKFKAKNLPQKLYNIPPEAA